MTLWQFFSKNIQWGPYVFARSLHATVQNLLNIWNKKMPTKTAYIPINYKVWRFQRCIAPNCGGSRFWENHILSFYWSKIRISDYGRLLDKVHFLTNKSFFLWIMKMTRRVTLNNKKNSRINVTSISWCYGYELGHNLWHYRERSV